MFLFCLTNRLFPFVTSHFPNMITDIFVSGRHLFLIDALTHREALADEVPPGLRSAPADARAAHQNAAPGGNTKRKTKQCSLHTHFWLYLHMSSSSCTSKCSSRGKFSLHTRFCPPPLFFHRSICSHCTPNSFLFVRCFARNQDAHFGEHIYHRISSLSKRLMSHSPPLPLHSSTSIRSHCTPNSSLYSML